MDNTTSNDIIVTIITIGDELLIGQVVDTNSVWIGQKLSERGIEVRSRWVVGDNRQDILYALQAALEISNFVLITGGLGPTKDDITKKTIADFVGVGMYFHQDTFDRISLMFKKLGRTMSENHHDQCLMPENTQILLNKMGTAPGMLFTFGEKILVSMPGVPYEMSYIMEEHIFPLLEKRRKIIVKSRTILTVGVGETIIENRISKIISAFSQDISVAYLPSLAQVRLRITVRGMDSKVVQRDLDEAVTIISKELEDVVFGYDEDTLESKILKLCTTKNIKIATAESCTGGLIAHKLVSIPGSSAYFEGSVVSYSYAAKTKLLSISEESLFEYGAVSEEVVSQMVQGARSSFDVDIALAISGIAGPDGGTEEKPVGTVWLAVGNQNVVETKMIKLGKDRIKNIESSSIYALDLLRRFILKYYF